MNPTSFAALGLPESLLAAVEQLGYEEPSQIQAASIPVALEGRDLIGLSETGSGKTAAFGLSGLARIDCDQTEPQMIVICPTRELAVQVCEDLQRLGATLPRLRAIAVYGGAPMERQIRALQRGVQLVVGTPGRLLDHVRRGTLALNHVRIAILDEADRMLDMGFADEMEELLGGLPPERQTLFFSATMNDAVNRIIRRYGRDPQLIEIQREKLTVDSIEQVCYEARQRSRVELLSRIIDLEQPRLSIIFCNTKRAVDECTEELLARGYSADRLHGDIAQTMRERVLRLFREGTVEILVATDVAARGIDISEIDIVFNYELPQDPEDYVHRIGRTGRAGRSGKAVSFIHGRDIHRIRTIERYTRQPIVKAEIPSAADVELALDAQLVESIQERIGAGSSEKSLVLLQPLNESGHAWDQIAGALMDLLREGNSREGEEIIEDRPSRPQRERGARDETRESRGSDRPEKSPEFRRDRSERPARPERSGSHEPSEAGMVSLFLNLGKNHEIRPGDIVGMLHNECHLEHGMVGRIQLLPWFSLVDVDESMAAEVIERAKHAQLRGNTFKLDYDRGPKNRDGGESPHRDRDTGPARRFPKRDSQDDRGRGYHAKGGRKWDRGDQRESRDSYREALGREGSRRDAREGGDRPYKRDRRDDRGPRSADRGSFSRPKNFRKDRKSR